MKRLQTRGFTLVELLIVIILIAILAAITIPKIGDRWRMTSEYRWKAQLNVRRLAIERFHADTGLWPADYVDVSSASAPATGLDDNGNSVPIPTGTYQGPYQVRYGASNLAVLHPYVKSLGYTYQVVAPGVGNLKLNTTKRALDGSIMGTW